MNFSSAWKDDDKPLKQGNRRLQGTIYFLAIQMIQLSSKGLPRNLAFYVYYQRQLARGKTKPQALILIARILKSKDLGGSYVRQNKVYLRGACEKCRRGH